MLNKKLYQSLGLATVYDKVLAGQRLSFEEGLQLFNCPDLSAVGSLALHKRVELHGANTYYVVNRQINYTNICVNGCVFCAFRRNQVQDEGAFLLSKEEILARIKEAQEGALKLDELHIVGGCHPQLSLEWFEDLLRSIKANAPDLPIKAFTPVEIAHFAKLAHLSTKETLERLKAAGLTMMPGGGAEIFDEDLRAKLCPHKADSATWLRVSKEAHNLGIKTNCTMLFGHLENYSQRVDHLLRLRDLQDETHGFTCFIPLPYLQKNNRLILPKERQGPVNALDDLRTIAVSRLLLDNIPHIKAYWVMLGVKLAQTALWYGANDL
ncbi:MAG: CofH family radical SAM protein, partial [Desulfovibrionaceae bacterium]|nr:CofH family radical SAM protein [Desulfovibrionaceae bacterium]